MNKTKPTMTSTKVVCAKCGKEYFVSFVADGHRKYYCDECLKIMHLNRKKGTVKKVFNQKLNKYVYEFVCDFCENFRRASYIPNKKNGLLICRECENKQKIEEQKKKRENKNIIIASNKDSDI